jgi:hypothetical protein
LWRAPGVHIYIVSGHRSTRQWRKREAKGDFTVLPFALTICTTRRFEQPEVLYVPGDKKGEDSHTVFQSADG